MLNVHLSRPEDDTPVVSEAMVWLANWLGAAACTIDRHRTDAAVGLMHNLLYEKPRSSESDFEIVLDLLRRVFAADGVTVLARQANDSRLYCVATTGLSRSTTSQAPDDSPYGTAITIGEQEPIFYDIQRDKGYTVFLAQRPGMVPRINNVLDSQEQGLPKELPAKPALKYRENFAPRDDDNRRVLAMCVDLAEADKSAAETLGLMRVLRRPKTKPFTKCDENLLKAFGASCRKAFLDWRRTETISLQGKVRRTERLRPGEARSGGSVRAFARILRPIPVSRSTRTLIQELVRDLCECYQPYEPGEAALARLLVRSGKSNDSPFQPHAEYGDPGAQELADAVRAAKGNDSDAVAARLLQPGRFGQRNMPVVVSQRLVARKYRTELRAPVVTWARFGPIDAVLAVDIDRRTRSEWRDDDLDVLFYASCRLMAILDTSDPQGLSSEVIHPSVASWSWDTIRAHCEHEATRRLPCRTCKIKLGAELARQGEVEISYRHWVPIEEAFDRDARRYGVLRSGTHRGLAMPLRLGSIRAGYFVCGDWNSKSSEELCGKMAEITQLWSHVSITCRWNWELQRWRKLSESNVDLWKPIIRPARQVAPPVQQAASAPASIFIRLPNEPAVPESGCR